MCSFGARTWSYQRLTPNALAHDFVALLTDASGGALDQVAEDTDIQAIVACCVTIRDIVYQERYWDDEHIRLDVPELARNGARTRRAMRRFLQARTVTLDIPQLATLRHVPDRCLTTWHAHQLRLPGDEVEGWESSHALFGAARYSLTLPSRTKSVYFGVKSVGCDLRAYFMVVNPHDTVAEIHIGLTGSSPRRCPASNIHNFFSSPGSPNVVLLRWSTRSLQLDLSVAIVGRAVLHAEAENSPTQFSFTCAWVFLRPEKPQHAPALRPMLTPVASDVQPRPTAPGPLKPHYEEVQGTH